MSARSEKRPVMRELVRETVANAILDAAEAVAAERGPDGTTIAAIAERAGVAVGTLYNYFPDRDALLLALFKSRRAAMEPRLVALGDSTRLAPATRDRPAVERRLADYLAGVLAILDDHRRYCKVVVIDDGTFARIKGRQRPLLELLVEAVAEILRPLAGEDAATQAAMVIGAMRALVRLHLEQETPLAPAGAVLAATFVRGLAR